MTLKSKKLDVLFFVLGGLLVAVGISIFNAPNGIASGGFTGVATILNSLLKIPIGSTVLIMNIPIFIIGANKYGLKFIYKSIIATMIMTVLIDIVAYILPFYKGEKILCAVFGGLLTGVGLGIVFLRGATTGGVDIIAKILGEKFPHISIGNIILILDGVVIIASAIVYQNIENALFAVVAIFVQSKAIDTILYGSDKGRLILVKSEHCEEIVKKSKLITLCFKLNLAACFLVYSINSSDIILLLIVTNKESGLTFDNMYAINVLSEPALNPSTDFLFRK